MDLKLTGKLPDLRLPRVKKHDFSLFSPPLSLLLIQEKERVSAYVCKDELFKKRIVALFHAPLQGDLKQSLSGLNAEIQANGYGVVWKKRVRICLPSCEALFQDFHLPPSSLLKAKKTVPLLLDSEFPFNADQYALRISYVKEAGIYALITIIANSLIDKWSQALQEFNPPGMDISLMPWPLLAALPALKAPCLLFSVFASCGTLCAINAKGQPLAIKPLISCPDNDEGSINMLKQARLLINDPHFQPERVLFFGEANTAALKKAAADLYKLPCLGLGDDLPLAGGLTPGLAEDPASLLAQAIVSTNFVKARKIPSFSRKFRREKKAAFPWLIPASIALLLLAGLNGLALLNIWNNHQKAASLREMMTAQLKSALENLPPNASLGRMTAILDSRLREMENNAANGASNSLTSLLENIHRACPENLGIHLQRLSYDDKHIRLNGTADAYEEINELKKGTETVPGIAESRIVNAAAARDKNRSLVEFELDLTRDGQ